MMDDVILALQYQRICIELFSFDYGSQQYWISLNNDISWAEHPILEV